MDILNMLVIIGTFIGIAGTIPGMILSILLLKDRLKNNKQDVFP
jgi:hypothetical protein